MLRYASMFGLALMAAMASAGWAWRDRLLLACSVALVLSAVPAVGRGAPWPPLTAALNALTGGALAGAAGIALPP